VPGSLTLARCSNDNYLEMDRSDERAGFRIDKVSFGGGVAGALMAFAAVGTLLSGLPKLWWVVTPGLVLGAIVGGALIWLRRR